MKVVNEDGSQIPPIGWQLPNGDDGTPVGLDVNLFFLPPPMRCAQVRIANVLIEGGEWRFTEYKFDEE